MIEHNAELRGALRQLPVPEPSPDLLPRILRSRAMGRRITFPTRESTAPWRWIAAAAVATVLIGGTWVVSLSLSKIGGSRGSGRDRIAELLSGTMLRPSDGDDQETPGGPPQPKYPLILSDDLDPSRLTEGTWTYQATTTIDDILTQPSGRSRIRMSGATYAGRPAWMVKTSKEGWSDFSDTVYVDAASLRPQYAVAYGNRWRTRIVQTFSSHSGIGSIEITGPPMEGLLTGKMALPFPPKAVFTNDWSPHRLSVLLPAFPLTSGWRGSLYQTGLFSKSGPGTLVQRAVPLDLRVVGRDRVSVPAGTFDCWRMEMDSHFGETVRWTMWVSRDTGWLIKVQHGSDYVVNEVLEAYQPEVTAPSP